jgi:hypothetical protein
MNGTVAARRPARLNQASEPKVKRGSGRPVADLVSAFESAFEALVVEKDDAAVMVRGLAMLSAVHRQLRALSDHLSERAERLRGLIPVQSEIVKSLDRELCARTAAR